MFDYCVVMAGGSGTRLWPLSRAGRPKQFLPALSVDGKTFFDLSLERAFSLLGADGKVVVVAGKSHIPHILESHAASQPLWHGRITIIPEPESQNTAPALCCALSFIEKTDTRADKKIFVLPSDHFIEPQELFTKQALGLADYIEQENIGVFGIPPLAPETGFGYIEVENGQTDCAASNRIKNALSFHEKPNKETAERYVQSGNFYWNSGMFAFSSRFIKAEYIRHAPDIITPFERLPVPQKDAFTIQSGISVAADWAGLAEAYTQMRKISFDFAVVMQCEKVIMAAADFEWRDIGSWDEYVALQKTPNRVLTDIFHVDSNNSFVDSDIPVALCGVDDIIVVVRSGRDGSAPAVLIAKKGETQKVSALVEQIKAAGRTDLL